MIKSEKFEQMPKAILMAQKAITKATKNAQNAHLKSKYADLESVIEAVKTPLNENGLSFVQYTTTQSSETQTQYYLGTMLLHESGESLAMEMPIIYNQSNDPKAFGSGLTYAKRYSLQTLLGLPVSDDDGVQAGNTPADKKVEKKRPEPNKEEQAVLDAVEKSLIDSTPDNMIIDPEKLKKYVYSIKGSYVSDIGSVNAMAKYIAKNIKQVCIETGAAKDGDNVQG